jgi:putative ABC transport system permease protein
MSSFRQIYTVTRMNILNMPQRLGGASVVVIGNAGVVVVLVSVLAMAVGFSHTINGTGRPDRVIVLRGGSSSELSSVLTRDTVDVIVDAPGVKTVGGQPVASREIVVGIDLPKKGGGGSDSVTLRGVSAQEPAVRPEIQLTGGRLFSSGKHELIVGRAAQLQFAGLAVGNHVKLGSSDWNVVGSFTSRGDLHESELLADVVSVAELYRRRSFNSIAALLDSPQAFDTFKTAVSSDPQLSVEVVRESDYFAALSKQLTRTLTLVGFLVGAIMSIGAIFGALNTIYAAVSSRRVEIATLRAIGFGADSVAISVIVEAMLLSLAGGALGALLAWSVFDGNAVNTLGGRTQVVFQFMVTPALVLLGLLLAAAIGFVGGVVPALRAARMPVATALRTL